MQKKIASNKNAIVSLASAGETLRVHFGDSFELKESGSQGCIWTVPNQESDNDQGNDVTINIFQPENESKDNQTLEARPNSWKWQYVGNSKTSCNIKIWGAITDDTGTWTFESGNSATKTHQVTIIGI